MRAVALVVALAGGLALPVIVQPAAACSIRGTHCGYPSWAANAFEGRFGFKGNPAILTDRYEGQPPRNVYRSGERRAYRGYKPAKVYR